MRLFIVFSLVLLPGLALAQSAPSSSSDIAKSSHSTNTALQSSVDRLTQTNSELLDLLKKQQAVLEDIQYDRRLQSRQIESLEERLQETLLDNAALQNKIDKLSSAGAVPTSSPNGTPQAGDVNGTTSGQPATNPAPAAPPPPASFLPAAEADQMPGTPSWHRIVALSGDDSRSTDIFQIQGRQWRVLWHNQDKPGKAFENTSALFLNAFPKDDTVPQKVCAKLGSGGDSTQLVGPGNYYLKIEASGGSWELAVEDFH